MDDQPVKQDLDGRTLEPNKHFYLKDSETSVTSSVGLPNVSAPWHFLIAQKKPSGSCCAFDRWSVHLFGGVIS